MRKRRLASTSPAGRGAPLAAPRADTDARPLQGRRLGSRRDGWRRPGRPRESLPSAASRSPKLDLVLVAARRPTATTGRRFPARSRARCRCHARRSTSSPARARSPAFDAEAIGRGNSGSRPELRDTVWIALGSRDLGIVLAHELAHVLMDSGEHSDEPGNLMRDETAPENTHPCPSEPCSEIARDRFGQPFARSLGTARQVLDDGGMAVLPASHCSDQFGQRAANPLQVAHARVHDLQLLGGQRACPAAWAFPRASTGSLLRPADTDILRARMKASRATDPCRSAAPRPRGRRLGQQAAALVVTDGFHPNPAGLRQRTNCHFRHRLPLDSVPNYGVYDAAHGPSCARIRLDCRRCAVRAWRLDLLRPAARARVGRRRRRLGGAVARNGALLLRLPRRRTCGLWLRLLPAIPSVRRLRDGKRLCHPRVLRRQRVAFWTTLVLAKALFLFPLYGARLLG